VPDQQPVMKSEERATANVTTLTKVKELQDRVQKLGLDKSNELQAKASSTFKNLTYMIWTTFLIGIVLMATSLLLFIFKQQTLTVLGMGGLGITDFVALFLYKPMDRLQEADKDFVEQLIVLKSWALSVNLELLAMDVNNPDSVRTASKNIRTAATWSAHTIQDFLLAAQGSQATPQAGQAAQGPAQAAPAQTQKPPVQNP